MTERNHVLDEANIQLTELKSELCQQEIEKLGIDNGRRRIENQFMEVRDNRQGVFQFNDAVSAFSVGELLADLRAHTRRVERGYHDSKTITIYINSPGGSIIDGWNLIDEIERFKAQGFHFIARVRGMAASMAAVLLQVFDERYMGRHAEVMIHRALFGAMGKAYEIEDQVEFVKKQEAKIVKLFSEASGKDEQVFYDLFAQRKDIWLGLDEALDLGVVDAQG